MTTEHKLLQKPWKHDPRSDGFSHQRFFGTINPKEFPATLGRPLRDREDQRNTTRCAAYAGAVNGGYTKGFRFDPDWLAIQIGKKQGRSVDLGGSDPNAAMRAQRDMGYLPYERAPIHLVPDGLEKTGDPKNYPFTLDKEAFDNRIGAFLKVNGTQDTFDNVRSALLGAYNFDTKLGAGVQVFGPWYAEWTAQDMVKLEDMILLGYHSWLFVDFENIKGVPYLIAQNSWGRTVGNDGFFHFSREVVNRVFAPNQWGQSLKIPKTLTAEQIALAKETGPLADIERRILSIWYYLSETFGV